MYDVFQIINAMWYINGIHRGTALFDHINTCFKILKNNKSFLGLIKKLKHGEQFFDTMSEIEVIAYFHKRYNTLIEPEIKRINKKLAFFCKSVPREILFKAVKFRIDHKKQNFSFFDCVGYCFSREHNLCNTRRKASEFLDLRPKKENECNE